MSNMNSTVGKKATIFRALVAAGCMGSIIVLSGCFSREKRTQNISIFVGIDVSGSFYNSPYFDNAITFTAHYLYAHLHGLGNLKKPKALFVGSIGGETKDEPKAFHPIHDFLDKSPEEIEQDLRRWFPRSDLLTDFNAFFDKIATLTKRQNLVLAPVEVIMISDGIPDISGKPLKDDADERFQRVTLTPLDYLARSVTVRLLYGSSKVGDKWRKLVSRRRVKIFTGDDEVMVGWQEQLEPDKPLEEQARLFTWISDNVDLRVPRYY